METSRPLTSSGTNKGESKYERLRKIGIGSYGVVYKCVNRQSGQVVAIKRYSENDSDPVIRKIAMREVRMLRQLKHPNLINLIEVFRRKRRLHLVFDYCELTVLDVIEKYANNCPLNLIKKITWQTVNGVKYCHERNCFHRDIKPENILINQSGIVKLCDFGFARTFARSGSQPSLASRPQQPPQQAKENSQQVGAGSERQAFTDYVATRWYRAPELLIGEIYYDFKIDIWAIGCVTAELMRGEPVWPGRTDYDQLSIIKSSLGQLTAKQTKTLLDRSIYDQASTERLINQSRSPQPGPNPDALDRKLPTRVGQAGADFVCACLQMDPERRPTSGELLRHAFIRSLKMSQFVQAIEVQQQHRASYGQIPAETSNSDMVKRAVGAGPRRAHATEATLPRLPGAAGSFGWSPAKSSLAGEPRRDRVKRKYEHPSSGRSPASAQTSERARSRLPISTSRVQAAASPRLPLVPARAALNQQVAANGPASRAGRAQQKRLRRTSVELPPSRVSRMAASQRGAAPAASNGGSLAGNAATPTLMQQSAGTITKTTAGAVRSAGGSGGGGGNNNQLTWCRRGRDGAEKMAGSGNGDATYKDLISRNGIARPPSPVTPSSRDDQSLPSLSTPSGPARREERARISDRTRNRLANL